MMTRGLDKPLYRGVDIAINDCGVKSEARIPKQGPKLEPPNPKFETNSNVRNRGKFETLGF